MKKEIIMASAFAAGAATILYLITRRKKAPMSAHKLHPKHSRHLTEIFSRAKMDTLS